MNTATDFRRAIEQAGLTPPPSIIEDGKLHRFASSGDRADDSGWYTYFSDENPAGAFGCWRAGLKQTWTSKSDSALTTAERKRQRARLDEARRQRDYDEQLRHAAAAQRAQEIWNQAAQAPADHPYLMRKQVQPHGLRVDANNRLIVPVMIDGTIVSLQTIDANGGKLFLPGGKVCGGSFTIGTLSKANTLLLCEGFSTGASLHEATGFPVVLAFTTNNLTAVAEQLRQQHSTAAILICGDNDIRDNDTPNTGLDAATAAASAIDGILVMPELNGKKCDWNDIHVQCGLDAVKVATTTAIQPAARAMEHQTLAPGVTVSALSVPDLGEWLEITPIKTDLLPVEPLPPSIIPTPFRSWIKDVADRMQCPPDFVAAAMIVMTSSIIGAGCGIRPKQQDDWTVIPNLWGCVVSRPSTMKSPAIGEGMKPIEALAVAAKQDFDLVIKGHLAEVEVFKAQREAIQGAMRVAAKSKATDGPSMDCLKQNFATLEEPKAPVWRRYVTNDATIEKMAELQAGNPRGLMLFRDELVGLFATWDKDGHEADRTFYMEGWNGDKSHTSDRIGRGTTHVANLCVSLFGGIQPAKLTTYLHGAMRGLSNDGLVQRLQVAVYPDEPSTWALIDRPIDSAARRAAFEVVARLATIDFRQIGAHAEEGQTPYFRFADDAQGIFNSWLTELEGKLREDEEPVLQEHLGKYRSLMPSLALQFHVLNLVGTPGATPCQVSKECAEQAAAWCEYLESHARRIYGLVTNATAQAAAHLAKRLTKGDLLERFTVREVYRKGWSLLGDKEMARNACEELVSLGWLRELVTPPAQGQKRQTEYLTNPKVRG